MRCRLGEERGESPEPHGTAGEGEGYKHLSRVGEGGRLHTRVLLMRCAQSLHTIGFAKRQFPPSQGRQSMHTQHQIPCPNRGLDTVHQVVDLHTLLQETNGLGGSEDTTEERAIGARVTGAEILLSKRSTTPIGTVHLSRSVTKGREGGSTQISLARPLGNHMCKLRGGLWKTHYSPSEVRAHRLVRRLGDRRGKRTGGLRQGRQSARGSHNRRERVAPLENVPPRVNNAED